LPAGRRDLLCQERKWNIIQHPGQWCHFAYFSGVDVVSLVLKETRGRVGIISLNNAARRNALSRPLVDELLAALNEFKEQSIRGVILRAAEGSKVWSAGHDVKELEARRDPLGYNDPLEQLLRAVQKFPGPVLAMVSGGVWGGAFDLVLTCDVLVGDQTCTFAITPVKLGIPYNSSGLLHFINRVGLNIAKEMFFTAEVISAERAERIGILNHLVPADRLFDFSMDLCMRMTAHSTLAVELIKEQLRLLSGAHPLSPDAFERIQGLRRRIYDSEDYQEGIRAFLEKRQPQFQNK
jgi:methylmalonyl-CoA decarboxylase